MRAQTTLPITRLKLGTNTARALVGGPRPGVTVAPDDLSKDPRYGASLTATLIGDTAHIIGTVSVDEVEIRIDAHGVTVPGVGTLIGLRVATLRVAIDDTGRVHVEAT
jgi:hypothetical protein